MAVHFLFCPLVLGCFGGPILFMELVPLDCNDCANNKNCWLKEKGPLKCERFEKYEDSARYVAYDRMMRSNRESDYSGQKKKPYC